MKVKKYAIHYPDLPYHEAARLAYDETKKAFKLVPLQQNDVTERLKEILTNPDCEVINVGMIPDCEGGLCIEYNSKLKSKSFRLIVGYTELGEWIEFDEEIDFMHRPKP